MMKQSDEEFTMTPWGCLSVTLQDYGIDTTNISPRVGEHLIEDFMDSMIKCGHIVKMEGGDK